MIQRQVVFVQLSCQRNPGKTFDTSELSELSDEDFDGEEFGEDFRLHLTDSDDEEVRIPIFYGLV